MHIQALTFTSILRSSNATFFKYLNIVKSAEANGPERVIYCAARFHTDLQYRSTVHFLCNRRSTLPAQPSMFRRDQPLLHQLPDEVLQDRIITLLPSSDQAAVRRTSKLLYNVSTRPFFRYLSLSEIPQIVKCCKVLTAKPEFADAVRELIVVGPM